MNAIGLILVVTGVAALALMLTGVSHLRRNAAARHAVLLCGLIAVAAAPLWHWTARMLPPMPVSTAIAPLERFTRLDANAGDHPPQTVDAAAERTPAIPRSTRLSADFVRAALFAIWAAGSLLMLVRLVVHGIRGARLTQRATDERVIDGVRVRTSGEVVVPMCIGWFTPVVLLPRELSYAIDPEQLTQVLAHESAHARRHDAWVVLLERLVEAAWWFHPLVHLLDRALDRAREQRCDDHVLALGHPPREYAQTLLRVAEWREGCRRGEAVPPALAVGLLCRLNLRRRVAGLIDARRNPMTRSRPVVTFCAAAGFAAVALLVSCAASPRAGHSSAAASNTPAKSRLPSITADAPHATVAVDSLPLYDTHAERGDDDLLKGDKVTIDQILCTADKMGPGELCLVRGTYTLASHDAADLSFYITSNSSSASTPNDARQTVSVRKGSGKFEVRHVLSEGWPHVSFYADGNCIGGVYFGQDESLLKVIPWKHKAAS